MKVGRELKEAINKHGEIRPPKSYEDTFYERINSKKKDIAAIWDDLWCSKSWGQLQSTLLTI